MPFYAVQASSTNGAAIFYKWPDCQQYTNGRKATFKKFNTIGEAVNFIESGSNGDKENRKTNEKAKYNVMEGGNSKYGGLDTIEDEEGKLRTSSGALVLYTDGACPSNGKRNAAGQSIARSGCGVFGGAWLEDSFANPSMNLPNGNTNNFAEAHAIKRALEHAFNNDEKRVEIRTDSNYCIDSLTKWSKGWKKNSVGGIWYNSSKKPVIHQEVFEKTLTLMEKIGQVKFQYVKGHSGKDHGNDMADKLAVRGARMGLNE